MGGGNSSYSGPPPRPRPGPSQGTSQAPFFGAQNPPPLGGAEGGGYYNNFCGGSGCPPPQGFQGGGWREHGHGMGGRYQGSNGPDPGILVYDNIVTGDPRTVMIGEGNRAGGRVSGRISGNRIIRS